MSMKGNLTIRLAAAFLLMFIATGARAQARGVEYVKILVPVFLPEPLPGAAGALWSTTFWMTNASGQHVSFYLAEFGPQGCQIPTCPNFALIPPGFSFRPFVFVTPEIPAKFMFVEKGRERDVDFSLRVQDLSRQSQTWGTEIPVVRDDEFRQDRIGLVDIPVDSGFRLMLRLYDPDFHDGGLVNVRVYAINPNLRQPNGSDTLLGEGVVPLRTLGAGVGEFFPGYAQVNDLDLAAIAPGLRGAARIRLELEPVAPTTRIWGFVTVTNNETQHVTTITPN